MVPEFAARHPRVGAILATNGCQSTYERPDVGGLFSYAVRSAALGLVDLDLDGRVTYREMHATIPQVLAKQGGSGPPGVVGPGDDEGAVFIDYRGASNAAPVCFTDADAGRYELLDPAMRAFAVAHTSTRTMTRLFLPATEPMVAVHREAPGAPARWVRFLPRAGHFGDLESEPVVQRVRGPQQVFLGQMMPRPIEPTLVETRPEPPPGGARDVPRPRAPRDLGDRASSAASGVAPISSSSTWLGALGVATSPPRCPCPT